MVAGHVFYGPSKTIIYVFHMPFFFLVGGYLFRSTNDVHLFFKMFRKIGVPYIVFLAALSLPEIVSAIKDSGFDDIRWRIRRLIVGGEALRAPLTIFWFPTCYLFTVVIYNFLSRRLPRRGLHSVCSLLFLAAVANQYVLPGFWLPLAINVCAMSIPMFHVGFMLGRHIFHPSLKLLLVYAVLAAAYGFAVVVAEAPPMAMKIADYGIPFVTLFAAISMSSVLSMIGRAAAWAPRLCAPIAYCSAASMTIMYVHMPLKLALDDVRLVDGWSLFVLTVAASLLCHAAFSSFGIGRRLLLGQSGHVGARLRTS